MEICCRGGAAVCAKAGARSVRKAKRAGNVGGANAPTGPAFGLPDDRLRAVPATSVRRTGFGWARFALPSLRCMKNLIIDHDAPGNAPHRYRHGRLSGLEIDHGDIVAKTVGDVERLFVTRHAETPGALADQNVAQNLAGRHIDHGHVRGVAKRHISYLAVPGDAQVDGGYVGLAHAWRQELELAFDGEFVAVDDVDLAGQFGRHP